MNESILATAARLSDDALFARLKLLAGREREATVELVAHLAELDARKTHLGEGPGSLYVYCRDTLHLSEDAAWNRAATASAVRRYPLILDWLADGSLTVTTVRVLRPVLTPENHLGVLTEARHRSKKEAELIVARIKPQPDVPSSIRKLPAAKPIAARPVAAPFSRGDDVPPPPPTEVLKPPSVHRPVIAPLTPERYRMQFTVSKETHDKLRRVQDLLCREVADGDPAVIFDRALDLLLCEVERKKIAATTKPRRPRGTKAGSREIPAHVRRAVWKRDGGRFHGKGQPVHRAAIPRMASRPASRPRGARDGGEHLSPVPRSQRLRGRSCFRPLRPVRRPRDGGEIRCFRGNPTRSGTGLGAGGQRVLMRCPADSSARTASASREPGTST